MPLVIPGKNAAGWFKGFLSDGVDALPNGDLRLSPVNKWPNAFLTEIADDGAPTLWNLAWNIRKIIGSNFYISRENRNGKAPLVRQNVSVWPQEAGAYSFAQPIVEGVRNIADVKVKPQKPTAFLEADQTKGLPPGEYGYAYGFSGPYGKTTPSGIAYGTVASSQGLSLPLPESFPQNATHVDVYLTKANGTVLWLQRSFEIARLGARRTVEINTFRSQRRAPTENESGIGNVAPFKVKGPNKRVWQTKSVFDLKAGEWRFAWQPFVDGLPGTMSPWSDPVTVVEEKEWKQTGTETIELPEGSPKPKPIYRHGPQDAQVAHGGTGGTVPLSAYADSEDGPFHEAEGKRRAHESPYVRAGGSYMGEEVDFQESRLVALVNVNRRGRRYSNLIINRDLNRLAYLEVGGANDAPDSEYPADTYVQTVTTVRDDADEALSNLSCGAGKWGAVGVAREQSGTGFLWALVFGNEVIGWGDAEAPPSVCETVDGDGNTHFFGAPGEENHGEYLGSVRPDQSEYEDARYAEGLSPSGGGQDWSCVGGSSSSPRLGWSYSGSYGSSHANGAGNWVGKCKVNISQGGSDVRASDASLGGSTYGRTYEDGRMYGDSYKLSVNSGQTNEAMWCHEYGHALGLGHSSSTSSIMYFQINAGRDPNPTSSDVSTVQGMWGQSTGGGGSGNPGGGGSGNPGGGGEEEPEEPETVSHQVPVFELKGIGVRRDKGFRVVPPKLTRKRKSVEWRLWVMIDNAVYYAYPKLSREGQAGTFTRKARVLVHGYPSEEEPVGMRVGLAQGEIPTEDQTGIEAPDPTTAPEQPEAIGQALPKAGRYRIKVSDVYEGSVTSGGGIGSAVESVLSDDVELNPTTNQIMNVSPVRTVNLIRNAEGKTVGADGKPKEWDFTGTSTPGQNVTVDEGVWTLFCGSTSVGAAPTAFSSPIEISTDQPLTLAGFLEVALVQAGEGRIVLQEYSSSGAMLRENVLVYLQGRGTIPFEVLFGPGDAATPFVENTSYVRVGLKTGNRTGSNAVNVTMRAHSLQAVRYNTAIRRVFIPPPSSGRPANFEPPLTRSLTDEAFIAVGAPPLPPGRIAPSADPALEVIDFETGGVPSDWAGFVSGTVTQVRENAASLDPNGSWGLRIQDASTNGVGTRYYRKRFTSLDGTRFAIRTLMSVVSQPTSGFHEVLDVWYDHTTRPSGSLATFRINEYGNVRCVIRRPNSLGLEKSVLVASIAQGSILDLEIVVSGGTTPNGSIVFSLGADGEPRKVVHIENGVDLRNAYVRMGSFGISASSEAKTRAHYRYDNIVPTLRGDVIDRERPKPPQDYVIPDEDRPYRGSGSSRVARNIDPDGETINQLYAFLPYKITGSGLDPGEDAEPIPFLDDPIPVKPGKTYTVAAQGRWSVFGVAQGSGDYPPGIRVWLHGPGKRPRLAVSGVQKTSGEAGMFGKRPWADDWATFTVPDLTDEDFRALLRGEPFGYTEARVELILYGGVYVFQEFLFANGALDTQSKRDAARTYSRASTGQFSVILPKRPPHDRGPQIGTFLAGVGAVSGDSGDLDALYVSSNDVQTFTNETTDPSTVENLDLFRISGTINGDGRNTGSVDSESVFVETWHPIGTLCREDRTEFPGMAMVGNAVMEAFYPDTDVDRIGGHIYTVEQTDDIGRLNGFTIVTFTEAAAREIWQRSLRDEFVLEEPHAGDRVAGKGYRLRFASQLVPQIEETSSGVFTMETANGLIEVPRREIYAIFEVEADGCEVLEVFPLRGPRREIEFSEGYRVAST